MNANGNYNGPLYAITGTYFAEPWQGYNIAAVGTASALTFTFVDTEHDASLDLEAKRLGTLDVKALLELLKPTETHIGDGAEVAEGESS